MKYLLTKISNVVKRALITLINNDSKSIAHCQAKYLDKVANIETIYPYGLSANAPVGNIVLLFNVGSNEANLAGIPYSQKDRFKNLKSGEVIVGSPKSGSYIKFLENGDIEIESKNNLTINAKKVNINATQEFNIISPTMNFTSDAFSFSFDASGVFQGNGTFNFGTGGAYIARLGDQVTVGGNVGTITSASTNNKSN
jgi:phage gp45-like